MKNISLLILMAYMPIVCLAQSIGNLDFSSGDFTGWDIEAGKFELKDDGTYAYTWGVAWKNKEQRVQLFPSSEDEDPIIACSDFMINPFGEGTHTMRIGRPTLSRNLEGCEGYHGNTRDKESGAERASYTFTVTEETKALIVNFAGVLRDPSVNGNSSHFGQQIPFYSVIVTFTDENGEEMTMPCSNFESSGNANSSYLIRNSSNCTKSKAVDSNGRRAAGEYMYIPWTSTIYDLQGRVGWKVKVSATIHDCLVEPRAGAAIVAGGHEAYGYLYARTTDLKLETNYCESSGEDPVISAPEGFASYEWRVNGRESAIFTKVNAEGSKVSLARELITEGATYSCTMRGELGTCDPITISTTMQPINVVPQIGYKVSCDGEVTFENKTIVEGGELIDNYKWEFTAEDTSILENPTYKFPSFGNYRVRLTGTTETGCYGTGEFNVTIPFYPKMFIEAEDTVCEGNMVDMYVQNITPNTTVTWLDSMGNAIGSGANLKVKMERSNRFFIKCMDNGCEYRDSVAIGVTALPKTTLRASKEIVCEGEMVEITAENTEKCSFAWSNGGSGATTKVYPSYTTEYMCTSVGSAHGCSKEDTIKISVYPNPEISISAVEEICDGESVVLTASGGREYKWTRDGGAVDADFGAEAKIDGKPADTYIYKVTGRDANGCVGNAQRQVIVKPNPILTVSGITEVCGGEMLVLTATGADNYLWSNGGRGNTFIATMDETLTDAMVSGERNGCMSDTTIALAMLESPVLTIDWDSVICPEEVSDVVASGADTYAWGNGLNGEHLRVSPSVDTKYTLIGTAANGCTAKRDVWIRTREVPTIKIEGEYTVCMDSTAVLRASGAKDYLWDDGGEGAVHEVKVIGQKEVTVTGTNADGCQAKGSITIIPVEHPTLSFIGQTEICLGDYVNLRAQGATEFEWHYGNEIIHTANLDIIPEGDIMVKLIGTVMHCSADMYIDIHTVKGPDVTITGEKIVCPGTPFTITAEGAKSYKWSTNDFTPSISYSPTVRTTYYVTGTDENGCEGITEYTVDVYPESRIGISSSSAEGCEGDRVSLYAMDATEYEWSSEPMIEDLEEQKNNYMIYATIKENTVFTLNAKDKNGCEAEVKKLITASERKEFKFDISPGWVDASNPSVTFNGISPMSATWIWTPHEGAKEIVGRVNSYAYDVEALGDSVGVVVRAIDTDGCSHDSTYTLYIWKDFFAPSAFSPNGDGTNDVFRFYGGRFVEEFSYIIYNRLGEIVFEGKRVDDSWDGNWNGKECPWGVYGWVCNYVCSYNSLKREGETRGFVTLVR